MSKPLKSLDELVELIGSEGSGKSIPKHPIVCLCGSMRFRKEWEKWACILSQTSPKHIVIMAHCFKHGDFHGVDGASLRMKRGLDLLHWYKIKLADVVFIIDVKGYIGESTRREIRVAERLGKKIRYMSEFEGVDDKCLISL